MRQTSIHHSANVGRFTGFAALCDDVRPQPPATIIDVLLQLAQIERPRLVVDLGCGAGLSTRIWAERADQVVGVEPNAYMRRQAEWRTTALNIRYHKGFPHQTELPAARADIVLHNKEMGNAERLVDIALSQGAVATLLKHGLNEEEIA